MLRSAFIVLVVAIVSIIGIPLQWISLKLALPSRRWIPRLFHRIVLRTMSVRVNVRGAPAAERPLLLVSNHASWLDIPVLTSILPVIFIAKSEVAHWPLFGLFAKLQRSVFVDRARRHATGEVNREIAGRLAEGDPVVLFGEGTASDGNLVLPFRSALLGALQEALGERSRGYVQPVSVAYTRLHGLPMGRQHRHLAAFYGDMDLLPHLKGVLREGAIDVVVTFGVPFEVEPGADRKTLARSTENAVRRMTAAALSGREETETGAVPLAAENR
ncbi:MAG: lysophospholipid acyltransferase family protein [Xanthobacteraceae bacterium]